MFFFIGLDQTVTARTYYNASAVKRRAGRKSLLFFCGCHPDVSDVCVIYIYNVGKAILYKPSPKSAFLMVVCLPFPVMAGFNDMVNVVATLSLFLMYNINHSSW